MKKWLSDSFNFLLYLLSLFSHWKNSLYLKTRFKERFQNFYANLHATVSVVHTNNAVGISICGGSLTDKDTLERVKVIEELLKAPDINTGQLDRFHDMVAEVRAVAPQNIQPELYCQQCIAGVE